MIVKNSSIAGQIRRRFQLAFVKQFEKYTSNYTIEASSQRNDLCFLYCDKKLRFEPVDEFKGVVDTLNYWMSEVDKQRTGFLNVFINLFVDDDNYDIIRVCLPEIKYNVYRQLHAETSYFYFNKNSAKEILDSIVEYCTENPIIFVINTLYENRQPDGIFNNAYTKAALEQARQAYKELKLIVEAANV